jgi:hypothetical protein
VVPSQAGLDNDGWRGRHFGLSSVEPNTEPKTPKPNSSIFHFN